MSTITNQKILVFDSGLGGLTVVSAIQKTQASLDLCYLADNEGFPYGKLTQKEVITRVTSLIRSAVQRLQPDAIVIACNTASTTALKTLRNTFPRISFLGVVPPIKPASEESISRHIGMLATQATAYGKYTNQLIEDFASDCHFTRVADSELAVIAENKLYQQDVNLVRLKQILAPVIENKMIDTIVLGCTHYPHLLPEMQTLLPNIKLWIDPAPGLARHLKTIIMKQKNFSSLHNSGVEKLVGTAFFTRTGDSTNQISPILSNLGFSSISGWD